MKFIDVLLIISVIILGFTIAFLIKNRIRTPTKQINFETSSWKIGETPNIFYSTTGFAKIDLDKNKKVLMLADGISFLRRDLTHDPPLEITAEGRLLFPDGGWGIVVFVSPIENDYISCEVHSDDSVFFGHLVNESVYDIPGMIIKDYQIPNGTSTEYHLIKLVIDKNQISCYVDGKLRYTAPLDSFKPYLNKIGLKAYGSPVLIKKLSIY